MPKFAPEQITGRPQVAADSPQQYTTQVVAHPVDTAVSVQAQTNLSRLSAALNQFAPVANKYLGQMAMEKHSEDESLGFVAAKSGTPLPPTADPYFQHGFIKGTWDSKAIQASDEATQEYQQHKDDPNFDLNGFLQNKVKTDLNGITNPTATQIYMQRFGAMSVSLHSDLAQHQTDLVMQQRRENMGVALSDLADRLGNPNNPSKFNTPEEFTAAYAALGDEYGKQSITRPEVAQGLLTALQAKSESMNGNPDLFDVFSQPQPGTGKSLTEMNPKLALAVEAAKSQAQSTYDTYMVKQNFSDNQQTYADLVNKAYDGTLTKAELDQHTSLYDVFGQKGGHSGSYSALLHLAQKTQQLQQDAAGKCSDIAGGKGFMYSADIVKTCMGATLGNDLNTLKASIDDPSKAQDVNTAFKNITTAITRTGTTIIPDQLHQLANSVQLMAPAVGAKDVKVPPRFEAIANGYRTLRSSTNPGLASKVFEGDSLDIMRNYDWLVQSGVEPNTAYTKAFYFTSPEGKELLSKRVNSPAGQQMIQKSVSGSVTGWVDNMVPGWHPDYTALQGKATEEARRFLMSTDGASDGDLKNHLQQWAKDNFVHDKSSNTLVQVMPGEANPNNSAAFSSFTDELRKQMNVPDAKVNYQLRGDGHYSVDVSTSDNRLLRRVYPNITQDQITKAYAYKTTMTAPEDDTFRNLTTKLRKGTLTLEDVRDNEAVIAKARSVGLDTTAFDARLNAIHPFLASGKNPVADVMVQQNTPPSGPINPAKATIPAITSSKPVVQSFMQQGDYNGALTAMGEGVALQAHADPSTGEPTIGLGYNIAKNAGTAEADFRAAGIKFAPAAVAAGKVSITPEQAARLYQVVQPRYTSIAQQAFDKYAKEQGAFAKLPPQSQAVLTDMAYQSGAHVGDFHNLFDHMLGRPNKASLADSLAMTYKSNGKTIVDTHRQNLRLSLLQGRFGASLRHIGYIN